MKLCEWTIGLALTLALSTSAVRASAPGGAEQHADVAFVQAVPADPLALNADPSGMDCNNNGIPDDQDIAGPSNDFNGNGIPDECDSFLSAASQEPGTEHRAPASPGAYPPPGAGASAPYPMSTYLATGEFYHSIVDLQIRGRGLDFVWARKYRSKHGPNTTMGNNWDHSYNIYIEQVGPDRLLHDGNSRQDLLTFDPVRNSWYAPEFFRELRQNGDGTYTLTFSDTGKWNFRQLGLPTAPGRIGSIVDRNGNTLTFQYDGSGRLQQVIDTVGRSITIAYNPGNRVASVSDFSGRQVQYQYYGAGDPNGSNGDLRSVRTPVVSGTPTGNNFLTGKTTIYTYTTGLPHPSLNSNLLTITDPKGQTFLRNTYDTATSPLDLNFDRLIKQSWGTPGLDDIEVVYVPQVPSPSNQNAVMKAIVNDRMGNVEELYYDLRNRGVMRREYTGRALLANQPTDDFDNRPMNPLRVGDPDWFETRWQYNADSLATMIRRHNQNQELYQYDSPNPDPRARGNLMFHQRLPGPLGGDQPSIQEQFQYEPNVNFITMHVDGNGGTTFHVYDPLHGNKLQTQHRKPGVVEDWEYNNFGQVTAHVLPDNGSLHRRRDEFIYYGPGPSNGYLQTEIVDATGFALETTYTYNQVGNVVSVVDPTGRSTLFSVNQLGQVIRQSSRIVSGTLRYQRDSYYDANDNVTRVDVQNRDENGVLQANTHLSTLNDYEVLNNLIRVTEEIDVGLNAVTEYSYDRNRNRTLAHRHPQAVSGADPSNVVETRYDERDLTFQIARAPGNLLQSSTQIDYDGNGNAATRTTGLEGLPRVNQTFFDGYDRAFRSFDRMGNETLSDYDANGNMVHEIVMGELNDLPGGGANVRLSEATYVYDAMDRRVREDVQYFDAQSQAPLGDGLISTETEYSDNSQITALTDAQGNVIQTTYDTVNRASLQTDPLGNTVTYFYDNNSNITQIIQTDLSQLGSPDQSFGTQNSYDGLDRLITTQDGMGNTTTYAYDSRDNRILRTDALGHITRYEYDGLNRMTRTINDMDNDGASASDPDDVVTQQIWDRSSRLVSQSDDNGNLTNYTYDGLNRRTATQYADGTSASTTYNVHDDAIQTQDANGTIIQSQYDLSGRVTQRSILPGPGVSSDTTFEGFAYDGLSHLVQANDNDSIVTRAYDSASHVLVETINGVSTVATYDELGNQQSVQYPGGRLVSNNFDALGRYQSISDNLGFIAANSYYGPSRVERRTFANNVGAEYLYDPLNRPVAVTHRFDPGGLNILRAGHILGWDATYNKTSRQDQWDGSVQTFTYDAISQLRTSSGGPAGPRDYTHDGVANRTNVLGAPPVGGPYAQDGTLPEPGDRQMNQYTSTPEGERTYDKNGNLVSIGAPAPGDCDDDGDLDGDDTVAFVGCLSGPVVAAAPGCDCADMDSDTDVDLRDFKLFQEFFGPGSQPFEGVLLSYDYANRMVEYDDQGNDRRHEYAYDALSRRIAKVVDADGPAVETRYYYNGQQVIEERDQNGLTTATYAYGDSYPDGVISADRFGIRYYYHTDDMYNVVAVTDAGGNVVERYQYDDFGLPFIEDGIGAPLPASGIGNTRLFTGHDYDAESGLYYCRTRYLDPISGRYTTRGLAGVVGAGSSQANSYCYVGNNPWSRLDPGGLGAFWWWHFTYWPAWWVHPWAWYPYICGWYPYHWYWFPWGWWSTWYCWYPYWGWWCYPCHWWWWGWGWGWWQCPYWWWYGYHWWWHPWWWWWYPYGYWFNPWGWFWYPYWGWYSYGWWYPYGWWWYPYFWGWGWGGWWGWYYPYLSWWWYPYVWWYYPWGGWWYWGWGWNWWWSWTWWHWYGWWWWPWYWWHGCWWWDWWWPGWWCHWWWCGWWWGWWHWGWWWPGWWCGWWWWGWWWPCWWSNWWWGWWWWNWWHGWWWWGWGWWWWGWAWWRPFWWWGWWGGWWWWIWWWW